MENHHFLMGKATFSRAIFKRNLLVYQGVNLHHITTYSWWFQPLWKIWKSVGMIIPNIWKNKNVPKFQTTNQIIKPLEASIFDLDLCPCSGWAPKLPRLFGQVPTPPALVPSTHWIGRKNILYKAPLYIYHPISCHCITILNGKKSEKKL